MESLSQNFSFSFTIKSNKLSILIVGDKFMQTVFNRVEKKYLLNKQEYKLLLKKMKPYIIPDQYSKSIICNLYFDTNNFDLIKRSIEKPVYKEKVRLRSYGIPSLDSTVFLEIKKKYKKQVNKRRISLPLKEIYKFLENTNENTQIEKEIAYTLKFYQLKPMVYLAYNRLAFCGKNNPDFRITFDTNIRYRKDNLKLELGDQGKTILSDGTYIMEVKANFSYPLWFCTLLSELHIYPTTFSKYGKVYQTILKEEIYV